MASPEICALCNKPDTDHITGKLQRMPSKDIVAHYNCMMYSPGVVSIDSQEDLEGFDFNIRSVLTEIKRGRKLRCSYCKKIGATVGCDVESCRKNYHFPCLIKANGFPSKDEYIVHCELHKEADNDTGDCDGKTKKDRRTSRKRKRLQSIAGETRKNTIKNPQNNEVMPNVPIDEQSECSFLLSVHPIETEEDCEEAALPSLSALLMSSSGSYENTGGCKSASKIKHLTCRKCETLLPDAYEYSRCSSCRPHPSPEQPIQEVVTRVKDFVQSSMKQLKKRPRNQFPLSTSSETSSEESDSLLAPKVKEVFSLSGFPKEKKKRSSKRKPNVEVLCPTYKKLLGQLEKALQGMSSLEKKDLSQIYSEFGGSLEDSAIEMASPQENQNDTVTTEDSTTTHVTDTSTISSNDEIDKTPERLPDLNVQVTPPRTSTEEKHFTEEHPVSSRDEEIPDKMSASSFKSENKKLLESVISKIKSVLHPKSSDNNIKESVCMSTPDASAFIDIPEAQSSKFPNGTVRPVVNPMATNNGNRRVAHLEALNDIKLTAQQINSTNCQDMLSSQPTSCTDASKSIRPDTSVGYPLDHSTQQQASNLEAQGTSETHSSGCPAATEPESSVGPPLTLEKDVNKTEVSPSVSKALVDNMESGLLASQHLNRESLPLASPSNVTTWQNKEKVQNKGNISTIVSPKQIKAISKVLTTGNLIKQFKSIVPQVFFQIPIDFNVSFKQNCSEHIQSTIGSQKRNTTKGAEQRRDGQASSVGSPNSSTNNQPETSSDANDLLKRLENQERSGEPIQKIHLVCPEIRKSITLKRKLSRDFEELRPHMKLQKTEGNLSEQLEISEEQNDDNLRKNATSGTEGYSSEQLEISEEQNENNFRENATSGTEGYSSEQLEISEEQNENNFRENATSGTEGYSSEQLEISEEQNENNFRENATSGTEGYSSEQLEISEEQNENNFRENATSGSVESEHASEDQSGPSRMTTPLRQRTEGHLSEHLENSEEQSKNNSRENSTPGSLESERASEHQSGPSSMTTPFRRQRFDSRHRSKKRQGYRHGRFGDLDDLDGFGRAVAGQCRHLPLDRQAKYMSYVFASADLFRAYPILPELKILITSLQTALETSTIHSPCGSSV